LLEERDDPLSGLIGTILSQNTSDVNSGRAYAAMRRRYRTWKAVMEAPRAELEEVLRPAGLARTRSERIQSLLRSVIEERGQLNLDHLHSLGDGAATEEMLRYEGVGPKTAACVLLFSLGRDVFPVDTHIHRIFGRLGVIPESMGTEKAQAFVAPLTPAGRRLALHVNLIAHGRDRCHPRAPECGRCPVLRHCPWGRARIPVRGTQGS
jgi:endonuclease-3